MGRDVNHAEGLVDPNWSDLEGIFGGIFEGIFGGELFRGIFGGIFFGDI
jgi:hypothetical protein